jgi:glycosyltransferase involved in cell wall biosynthesis
VNPEPLTLSVIICCFTEQRWDLIRAAVDSVLEQTHPVDEVVVVVDHNDILCERLRAELHSDGVRVIPNEGPPGLSGTRNTGIRHATSSILAFLDDDAEAAPTWAAFLLTPYRDERVIGVGGQVVPRFERGRPGWLPPELDWVIGCTYEGHRTSRGPVRNLIGANMSLRREVFDEVGGFSTELGRSTGAPAGCEETELCLRATRELKGEVFYEPDALVRHFVPETRTTKQYLRSRCLAEGRSKALVTRITGRAYGDLHSERRYATRTVPSAVRREITDLVKRRRPGAWSRVCALATAFGVTAAGFADERKRSRARRNPASHADPATPSTARLREPSRVSIVVATRDRPEQLARALDAIANLDYPSFEVVVVENAARTLATVQAVKHHTSPDGQFRYASELKPGLARAHNRGVRVAGGPDNVLSRAR